MQRAPRNMLMTENGTEKLDNELITTLFENITTLAQLHQFTRAEGKKQQNTDHPSRRNVTELNRSRYPGFHQNTHPQLLPVSCQRLSRSAVEELNVHSCFASQFLDVCTRSPDNFKSDVSIALFHPLTCLLATFPHLTNDVYSSYDVGTITPN